VNKTLALLVRALRTESRDIKSHLLRAGLASLVVLILYAGYDSSHRLTAPGMLLFKWMTGANWVFVTLSGVTIFAISISEETERETLGLLRMANIGPLSLLLGKWLPRMLTAFVLISVQFPFTWLTVTLGGVSWEQIWASYLMLLAHLVLVGNVGLLASVLKPTSAKACTLAVAIVVVARVTPFLGLGLLQYGAMKGWWTQSSVTWFGKQVVIPLNNCTASGRLFGEILLTSFRGTAWTTQVVSNFAVGAALFCVSWLVFDRATMGHLSGSPRRPSWLKRLLTRSRRSSSSVWNWALGWKDFRQVGGGLKAVSIKFILYAALYAGIVYAYVLFGTNMREGLRDASVVVANIIFWFLLPVELCFLGAKLFRPEIQDQTWSTLLTLPQSLPELVYSKLGGAMLGLIPTLVVFGVTFAPYLNDFASAYFSALLVIYFYAVILLAVHMAAYLSVVVSWAVPMIAVACGVGITLLGNLLVWVMFLIGVFSVNPGSGGVDQMLNAWTILVICGNLILTGVVHMGIGQQLLAKGAQS